MRRRTIRCARDVRKTLQPVVELMPDACAPDMRLTLRADNREDYPWTSVTLTRAGAEQLRDALTDWLESGGHR